MCFSVGASGERIHGTPRCRIITLRYLCASAIASSRRLVTWRAHVACHPHPPLPSQSYSQSRIRSDPVLLLPPTRFVHQIPRDMVETHRASIYTCVQPPFAQRLNIGFVDALRPRSARLTSYIRFMRSLWWDLSRGPFVRFSIATSRSCHSSLSCLFCARLRFGHQVHDLGV